MIDRIDHLLIAGPITSAEKQVHKDDVNRKFGVDLVVVVRASAHPKYTIAPAIADRSPSFPILLQKENLRMTCLYVPEMRDSPSGSTLVDIVKDIEGPLINVTMQYVFNSYPDLPKLDRSGILS